MTSLNDIAVRVEPTTGNVAPLLHEIRHALVRLATSDEKTVIDLRALPLAPGEESRIEETLGAGEVRAELDALGPTSVQETAYSGVWLVTHRNAERETIGRFVEICRIPEILMAQDEDIAGSVQQLKQQLEDVGAA
jgi:hydrogenase-1 operon protein HyaF